MVVLAGNGKQPVGKEKCFKPVLHILQAHPFAFDGRTFGVVIVDDGNFEAMRAFAAKGTDIDRFDAFVNTVFYRVFVKRLKKEAGQQG